MTALNISVSKLTSFDDFLHGRWNQEDDTRLVEYLTGRGEKTYQQTAGDAVHAFIENPFVAVHDDPEDDASGVTIAGFHLSGPVRHACLAYRFGLPEPMLFEQWLPIKKVRIKGYEINLRSRVDIVTPSAIRDIKTTDSSFDYDRYADSYQWRYYLWLGQSFGLDTFCYDVFQWREKGQALRLNTITLYRYPELESDCMKLLTAFVDYLETRNLVEYCFAKPITV